MSEHKEDEADSEAKSEHDNSSVEYEGNPMDEIAQHSPKIYLSSPPTELESDPTLYPTSKHFSLDEGDNDEERKDDDDDDHEAGGGGAGDKDLEEEGGEEKDDTDSGLGDGGEGTVEEEKGEEVRRSNRQSYTHRRTTVSTTKSIF